MQKRENQCRENKELLLAQALPCCIRISRRIENQSTVARLTYFVCFVFFRRTTLLRNLPDARPLETYSPVVEGVNVFLGEEKSNSLLCFRNAHAKKKS